MRKPFLLTVLLLLVCSTVLWAQSSVKLSKAELPSWLRPYTMKPQSIDLNDISMGYYFELIENQYNLQNQTHFNRTIKVVSESAGAENAGQISVNFDPNYQKLLIHELNIIRAGQVINRLDLSKFKTVAVETELSRLIYNGEYSAFAVLDDVRKDDKIVFSYSLVGFNPVFEGKFANTYYLEGSEPNGLLHLVYIVPEGRILNIRKQKGAAVEKKQVKGNLTYYYWEQPMNANEGTGLYTPGWFDPTPRVEVSEFSTWRQVADWAKRINPIPNIKAGSDLDKEVQKLWQEAGGDSLKYFEKSLNFVQNSIRYMGIELGEHSHRAHLPEVVYNQRYGDCKDKSLLLASMLKSKGIGSSLILANTYQDKELDKVQPSPFAFNHMVLAAVLDGNMIAVDPTISDQGGYILNRYFPYYGKVLFLENGTRLSEVRKPIPNNAYFVEIVDVIQILDDGKANLKVKTTYFDHEAERMRTLLKSSAKNQLQREYEDYFQKIYRKAKNISPLDINDDLANNILTIKEEYLLEDYFLQEDSQNAAPVYSKYIYDRLPHVEDGTLEPIALNFPLNVNHEIKIVNKNNKPLGFFQPEEKVIDRQAYWYSRSQSSDKDTLKVSITFRSNDSFVPMEEVQQYVDDFKVMNDGLSYSYFVDNDGQLLIGSTGPIQFAKINFVALLMFIVILAGTIYFLLKKLVKTKPTGLINLYHEYEHREIGGWLIILAIKLVVANFVLLGLFFVNFSPISNALWAMLENAGNAYAYLLLYLMFYLAFYAVYLASNIYSCVLFFQRRDIFPQTYFIVNIGGLVIMILSNFSFSLIYPDGLVWGFMSPGDLWTILIVMAWSIYLVVSKRVKRTFTVPYQKDRYYYLGENEISDSDPSSGSENPSPGNYGPHPLNN